MFRSITGGVKMQVPQIRIQSQQALISINQQQATQQIKQPKATQRMEQPKAMMKMHTTPSKLTIDQTQAWNDMGLKSVKVQIEEASQKGKQKVLEGISRRINQGVQLMKIEHGGNPVVSQAVENGHSREKQFNIGWIPSRFAVKTDYQPAEVEIDITPKKPVIDNQANKPVIQHEQGKVDISLRQQADLMIDFEYLS